MNWYHREEERYVEYGTSFRASQAFGFKRSLTDTIYNMNAEHLSRETPTVFETLDDAGVRTAGTTYLMYRGRHRHEVTNETALTRIASVVFKQPVMGPREFFYADLFASRRTGCRSQLGLPGVRDQHAGCVGEYLVEHDLFDFLLLSLPDNDTHSHKHGPDAQVTSLVAADKQIERLMTAAGGPDAFLEDHAVIVCSDHSQSLVEDEIDLFKAFDGFEVLPASRAREPEDGPTACGDRAVPELARRAVYVLDRDERQRLVPRIVRTLLALDGVDLVDAPHRPPGRRGGCALAPRRAALRAARRSHGSARRQLERRGRPRGARARRTRRSRELRPVSGRAGPRLVGAALQHRRRGAGVGSARLGVPRLGTRAPCRRRLTRLAARERLVRLAALVRDRTRQRRREGTMDAARRRADGARSTSGWASAF